MSGETIPVHCTLADGNVAVFDVPWDEADDYDETWWLFELFNGAVGA